MKNSSPISLFSFQDIITSLTGIMIVVVLVILLQLVESARMVAAYAKMLPEYQSYKKIYEELLEKQKKLKQKIAANKEASDKYAAVPVEKIKEHIREEENFAKILEKKIAAIEKQHSTVTQQNATVQLRCDQLKKEIRLLSVQENEIKEMQAQLLAMQKMQRNISSMIRRKEKMLRFEFSGFESQTPLLIECNAWGFRCKRYPDGEVHTFGTPSGGSLPRHLPQLQKFLTDNGIESSYPVLLFREKSLPYYERIVEMLFKLYRKQSWGQELVGSNEEIF